MRSVPLRLVSVSVLAVSLALINGCGASSNISSVPTASSAAPTTTPVPPASAASGASGGGSTTSSTTPAPSPAPSAPSGTTISNIEQMSGWESCDTCSGGGAIAYSMTQSLNYPQA